MSYPRDIRRVLNLRVTLNYSNEFLFPKSIFHTVYHLKSIFLHCSRFFSHLHKIITKTFAQNDNSAFIILNWCTFLFKTTTDVIMDSCAHHYKKQTDVVIGGFTAHIYSAQMVEKFWYVFFVQLLPLFASLHNYRYS